jgi:hypothetical protein
MTPLLGLVMPEESPLAMVNCETMIARNAFQVSHVKQCNQQISDMDT